MLLVSQAMQMLCVRSQHGETVLRVLRKGRKDAFATERKGKEGARELEATYGRTYGGESGGRGLMPLRYMQIWVFQTFLLKF